MEEGEGGGRVSAGAGRRRTGCKNGDLGREGHGLGGVFWVSGFGVRVGWGVRGDLIQFSFFFF